MVKQTTPEVFTVHKLAHQRDAHPRRTNVTCGIPSKSKRQRSEQGRSCGLQWCRGSGPQEADEEAECGGGGREEASVGFAPGQSKGAGLRCAAAFTKAFGKPEADKHLQKP